MVTQDLAIMSVAEPPSPDFVVGESLLRNVVPTGASNVVVRREVLEKAGRFDTELRHMADWDMWIRLAQLGPPAAVAAPQLAYVMHQGNASSDTADAPNEMRIVERRYATLRRQPTVDRAAIYRWIAWHHLRSRQRRKAVLAYAQAVRAGDAASIARAVVGVLWPGVVWRIRGSHYGERRQEIEAWLHQLELDGPTPLATSQLGPQ